MCRVRSQERRSIKSFKPDPITREQLKQLVELIVAAPSSFNCLVQDEAQKAALSAASAIAVVTLEHWIFVGSSLVE